MPELLSQVASHPASVIIWSCVLVGLLVLAFVAVGQVKKRLRDDMDQNPAASTGFTLSDLRQLHRDGQMSDEEFEKAKIKIVDAARKAARREEQKSPGGNERG
jgi:uncharacterized membrane protein